jgi:hypothetical protein
MIGLHRLCKKHGGRIAGSKAYLGAANYTKGELGKISSVSMLISSLVKPITGNVANLTRYLSFSKMAKKRSLTP